VNRLCRTRQLGDGFAGKIAHNNETKKFDLYRKFNLYETQNTKNDLNLEL